MLREMIRISKIEVSVVDAHTFALKTLVEEAKQHATTVITKCWSQVGMKLEAMRHIYAKSVVRRLKDK